MATDYVFKSYFYGIENFDSEFGDAQGQLTAIKLGMKPKRPDKSKLKTLLEKTKAKGEFLLSRDGDEITFLIRIGTNRIELASLNLAAVKDVTKRRDLMFQMNIRTRLFSDADLKAFDEKHADTEDRPEAVAMNKRIDELKNAVDTHKIMLSSNYKGKEYNEYSSEFAEWIKKKGHQRYTAFVDDVKAGRGLGGQSAKLFDDPKTSGIRPATLAAIKAAQDKGEPADYKQARKEVMLVVTGLLAQYNKEKIAEYEGKIKTADAEIASLQKQLKVMKAD